MEIDKSYELFKVYIEKGRSRLELSIQKYIEENEKDVTNDDLEDRIDEILNIVFSEPSHLHKYMTENKSFMLSDPSSMLGEGSSKSKKQAFRVWLRGKASNLFVGFPTEVLDFPKKINVMENYALEQILGEAFESELNSNFRGDISVLVERSGVNVEKIDEMLANFSDRNSRETLTVKRVFIDKTHSLNNLRLKSGVSLDPETIDNFIQYIDSLNKKGLSSVLEPVFEILRSYDEEGTAKKIILSAPSITGKLDLRSLKNRKAIYSYWSSVDKEYEDFQTKYSDFINAVDKVDEEALTSELKDILRELKLFENEIKSNSIKNNLNYITRFKKMQVKGYMNSKVHVKLFVELLKNKNIVRFLGDGEDKVETDSPIAVTTYDKEGSQSGKTAEVTMQEEVDAASISEVKQLEQILTNFQNTVAVDPIYYRAFTDRGNSEAFKNTPIFENQLKRMKKLLLIQGAKFDVNYNTRIAMDSKILEYFEELKDLASVTDSMTEFYLPLSSTTKSDLVINNEEDDSSNNELNGEDIDNKSKRISSFLNTFSKIYNESVSPTATKYGKESSLDMGAKDIKGINRKKRLENVGTLNVKEYRSELINAENELDELLNAIIDFFIVPVYNQYVPFDDEIAFTINEKSIKTFKSLAGGSSKNNSFTRILDLERQLGYAMISAEDLREITDFVNLVNSSLKDVNFDKLKKEFKQISSLVKEMLLVKGESVIVDEINTEFGSFLYETLENNNLVNEWFEYHKETSNINGYYPNSSSNKTPKDWDEEFNPRVNYPFKQLVNLILRQDASLTSTSVGKKKIGSQKGITAFKTAIKDMKVLRSEDELKILDAHDSIRKMMGKPVYYNTSKTHNFDHVNTTIEILKKDFNIDVSAHEIHSIVNEVNSMHDISIKHGVPKEGVYFIKANFR